MVAHPRVSSLKSLFGPIAGLSVCTKHPEHISNQKRDIATTLRRKLTLISRAQMACLHSTAMSSIRWVLRPSRLVIGVCASIRGARTNAKPVQDEEQQRLDRRESPSDGSRAAPVCGATVKYAGRGVSRGHQASTPSPIWVMSMAVAFGTWQLVAFRNRNQMDIEAKRQEDGF